MDYGSSVLLIEDEKITCSLVQIFREKYIKNDSKDIKSIMPKLEI